MDTDDVERGYYVYLHKDKANGTPFYVGKGKGGRASQTARRNSRWRAKVETLKDGLEVEVVSENLTEEEAYDLERELIGKYGKLSDGTGVLVNKTSGGSLDFGESSIELFGIELPPEVAAAYQARYDKATYRKLNREERTQLAGTVGERMQTFCDDYRALGIDDKDDPTDLEFALDTFMWQLLSNADKLSKRKISYKDFCWEAGEIAEAVEDALKEANEQTDSLAVLALARRVSGFMKEQVALLKVTTDVSD